MKLKKIPCNFSICKVTDYPASLLNLEYCFIGKTDEENSLVCPTSQVPASVLERDDGWAAFRIEGVLDFSLIGVLARIAALLAEEQISIFALSTFNTDYILVKKENEERALRKLAEQGYQIQSCGL